MKRYIKAAQSADSVKQYFDDTYSLQDLIGLYDFWDFENPEEFAEWLDDLIYDAGYKPEDVAYVGYDGYDNDKLIMNDGTIFAIEGRYGQDYLVDITDNYGEE